MFNTIAMRAMIMQVTPITGTKIPVTFTTRFPPPKIQIATKTARIAPQISGAQMRDTIGILALTVTQR